MVKFRGLELLQSPNKISGTCGQEWSNFGTCCKVDQLTRLIKEDTVQINEAVNKLSEEHKSTLEFLQIEFMPRLAAVVEKLKYSNWNAVSQEEAKTLDQLVGKSELVYLMETNK